MATHSSVLAWRIPGTGEPGGLPSMGSHRVWHDRSDLAAAATSIRASPVASCNAGPVGDLCSIPGSGRYPGGGHDNPLQYSCLENPSGRGAWRATVHGVKRVRCDWSNLAHTQFVPGPTVPQARQHPLRQIPSGLEDQDPPRVFVSPPYFSTSDLYNCRKKLTPKGQLSLYACIFPFGEEIY